MCIARQPVNALAAFLEFLEPRRLLSGNVVVAQAGSNVIIRGDAADNAIVIDQAGLAAGRIRVAPADGTTTINGSASPAVFAAGGFRAILLDGNDSIAVNAANLPNGIIIEGGQGNTAVALSGVTTGDISVRNAFRGAVGGNLLTLTNVTARNVTNSNSAGNDTFTCALATIRGSLTIDGGTGDNSVSLTNGTIGRDLNVTNRGGKTTMNIAGMAVSGSVRVNNGDRANVVALDSSTVAGNITVLTGNWTASLAITGSTIGTLAPAGRVVGGNILMKTRGATGQITVTSSTVRGKTANLKTPGPAPATQPTATVPPGSNSPAASSDQPPPTTADTSTQSSTSPFSFAPNRLVLARGQRYVLAYSLVDQFGDPLSVTATWSKTGLAGSTVDSTGMFTADPNNSGTNIVTATVGSASASALVTVAAVASESFNYGTGNLSGQGGAGSGWGGAWSGSGGSVQSGSLTYTDGNGNMVVGMGNKASDLYNGNNSRALDTTAGGMFKDSLAGGYIGKPGGTMWISAETAWNSSTTDPYWPMALSRGAGANAFTVAVPPTSPNRYQLQAGGSVPANQSQWAVSTKSATSGGTDLVLVGVQYNDHQTFTPDCAKDTITAAGGTFNNGDAIYFYSPGALPAPLAMNARYYLRDVAGQTFKLARTPGGPAINLTDNNMAAGSVVRPDVVSLWINPNLAGDRSSLPAPDAFLYSGDASFDTYSFNFAGNGGVNNSYVSGIRVTDSLEAATGLSANRAFAGQTLGRSTVATQSQLVGLKFTPNAAVTLTDVALWKLSGNTQSHTVKLLNSSGTVLAAVTISLAPAMPGTFNWTSIGSVVTLTAGQSYYLVVNETLNGDAYYDGTTIASGVNGNITINNAVTSTDLTTFTNVGSTNNLLGPLNMAFAL